jgi:hypothetical protein
MLDQVVRNFHYGYLSFEKMKNYIFFSHTSEMNRGVIIVEVLKKEIEKSGITGVDFDLADVVTDLFHDKYFR